MVLVNLFDDRISILRQTLHTTFEHLEGGAEDFLDHRVSLHILVFLLCQRAFHSHCLEEFLLEALVVGGIGVFIYNSIRRIIDGIQDIEADTFTHQGVATSRIDDITLRVHHIVVFQQTLTDTEVILLDLLLRPLYGFAQHTVFQNLAFLESELVHQSGNLLGCKQTHQVVFQRDIEHRRARVALTSGTSAQLSIDAAALMALRTDDGETTCRLHFRRQLDICTTTCHVGSYRYRTCLTGKGDDFSLLLVQLRVQYIMFNLAERQHSAQQFGDFYRGCTHQDGAACLCQTYDFIDDCSILLALRLVDTVIQVLTGNRAVCRDDDNVQLIDTPELACLCLGRTRHTSEFVVHTEVVLQGDGSEGLRRSFHLHAFLGFDGLVQSVGVAAAVHDTSGLLIDNHYLIIHHHVFIIFFKQCVGFEELVHGVYAFALHRVVRQYLVFLRLLLFFRALHILEFRKLGGDIRHDEEVRVVAVSSQEVDTLVRKFDTVILLVNNEVQLVCRLVHVPHVL